MVLNFSWQKSLPFKRPWCAEIPTKPKTYPFQVLNMCQSDVKMWWSGIKSVNVVQCLVCCSAKIANLYQVARKYLWPPMRYILSDVKIFLGYPPMIRKRLQSSNQIHLTKNRYHDMDSFLCHKVLYIPAAESLVNLPEKIKYLTFWEQESAGNH